MKVAGWSVVGLTVAFAPAHAAQSDLVDLKHAMMEVAYRGDLDRLEAIASTFTRLAPNHPDGSLAYYHAGFARFVLALMRGPNGLDSMAGDPARMLAQVDSGIAHLETAVTSRSDFADAMALLAHLYSMKIRADPRVAPSAGPRARALLSQALAREPNNPRVALIDAMRLFWAPADRGGNRESGIDRWREAIGLFAMEIDDPTSAAPSWGLAEAWAWLPAAYLALEKPDTAAAREAARRAIEVRPDFRWIRVSLLPRVDAAIDRERARKDR